MGKPLNGAAYVDWLRVQVRRRARILRLFRAGISQAEIGRRLGISRERVRQIVKG